MIASKKNDSALEVAFEEETRQRLIKDTRTAVFASFFMYPVFVPLDYLFYPKLAGIFLLLRVAVVLLGAVVLSLLKTTFAKDHPRPLAIFEYLNGALAIVLMVHLADGYLSPYYAGINLVFICMLFIVPMNVKETGLVAGIVYAAYIIPILIKGGIVDIRSLAGNNFFMVSTMLLAVLSSYLATQMRRKEFTSRYELGHALEELRELDVLKSQFFASISHEIRTPLTSVLAPTESLRRGEVEPLQTGQKSLVDQVHRNSLRLLDLINQMLDFAKFDAGKMKLRLKRVNMSALARNNVTLFKDVCFRKGVSLEHQISPDIPIVYLDKEKVERIISNLVRNAIKFTDRGRITVALSMEEIDGKQWIILKVSDTGIGISFEDREKVFEHFHQVDGSTTRQYEGTGLGLSIVQESVGLQHGFVEVDSEVGTGSTFTVGLPTDLDLREPEAEIDRREVDRRQEAKDFGGIDRRTSDRRRGERGIVSVSDLAMIEAESFSDTEMRVDEIVRREPPTGIRVLYVEDNIDLRRYVNLSLTSFGHTVVTAANGIDGWKNIQNDLPDIIVSDVMMPGLDGFDLTRLVKTTPKTRKIPVILITAKSETDARIEGLEIGADDYMGKPIDMRELNVRIKNIVSDRKVRDALTRAEEVEERSGNLSTAFPVLLNFGTVTRAGIRRMFSHLEPLSRMVWAYR